MFFIVVMDLIKSQKLKENRKRDNLIHNILVHLLTTVTCAFLCSYGFWLPPLISSTESSAFVLLPQWKPFLVNTKTMFLFVNLIVTILVGDSGFRQAAKCLSSSPYADLYDEYVERSKRLQGIHVNGVEESDRKEERAQEVQPEADKYKGERKSDRGIKSKELPVEEPTRNAAEDLQETKSDEGGESNDLPPEELTRSAPDLKDLGYTQSDEGGKSDELRREELTRRIEEFITTVNRRRWFESSQGYS